MNPKEFMVNISVTLREAMKVMDRSAKRIVFIEENEALRGVLTDGDFRRWILKSGDINAPVREVMNNNPVFVYTGNEKTAKLIIKKKEIDCIPVIDKNKKIVSAIFKGEKIRENKVNAPVVIMAGGEGKRLYPYTKVLPKPLIPIGEYTIIERIVTNFVKSGCEKFYLTLNYKKNMIKAYFNDLNYDVEYIDEDIPLGTGGSLFYLKGKIKEPFFVSNCDILIEADYGAIYKFHKENHNLITVVASIKNTVIPYGVIEINEDGTMKNTMEKPQYSHLINTGMYIIEPEVLDDIKKAEFIHITEMINNYINQNKRVGVFPIIEESYLDMGQVKEMENMIKELESRG